MSFLILADYYSSIESANLQQIISDTDSYRSIKEQAAITEVKSYLVQKFITTELFRDTLKFSFTRNYNAKQLVYLDADLFSASSTYAQYDLVRYSGSIYYAKTALTAGAWNASNFQLLGVQYEFYYIPTPYDEFNKDTHYYKDNLVFYNNKVYKCLRESQPLTHEVSIQFNDYREMPYMNEFPDGFNQTQWGSATSYNFSGLFPIATYADFDDWDEETAYVSGQRVNYGGTIYQSFGNSTGVTPNTDITKWNPVSYTSGDNRNALLVEAVVVIALYKLSMRISPRNVPDLWVKKYDDTIAWLKMCAKGEVTLDAPLIQTKSVGRVRWGSAPERINNY